MSERLSTEGQAARLAAVEALAERLKRQAVERGPFDEVSTDSVVAMLQAALRGDPA